MLFQLYSDHALSQIIGWVLVFCGLIIMNEIGRRTKQGGIAVFVVIPVILTVYFILAHMGMFGGPDADVVLRCRNELVGVIIDRFGTETAIVPEDGDHFHVRVKVAVSPQFYGWVTGIGAGIEIVSPAQVREEYKVYLQGIMAKY